MKIQNLVCPLTSGVEASDARTQSIAGTAVAGAQSSQRPELRGRARARSTLLAALIRARARPCEDPIETEGILIRARARTRARTLLKLKELLGPEHVRARTLLKLKEFFFVIIITTKVNRLFGGLNIFQNTPILACASVAV